MDAPGWGERMCVRARARSAYHASVFVPACEQRLGPGVPAVGRRRRAPHPLEVGRFDHDRLSRAPAAQEDLPPAARLVE